MATFPVQWQDRLGYNVFHENHNCLLSCSSGADRAVGFLRKCRLEGGSLPWPRRVLAAPRADHGDEPHRRGVRGPASGAAGRARPPDRRRSDRGAAAAGRDRRRTALQRVGRRAHRERSRARGRRGVHPRLPAGERQRHLLAVLGQSLRLGLRRLFQGTRLPRPQRRLRERQHDRLRLESQRCRREPPPRHRHQHLRATASPSTPTSSRLASVPCVPRPIPMRNPAGSASRATTSPSCRAPP